MLLDFLKKLFGCAKEESVHEIVKAESVTAKSARPEPAGEKEKKASSEGKGESAATARKVIVIKTQPPKPSRPPRPSTDENGRVMFRTNQINRDLLNYESYYQLNRVDPEPYWEIAGVGVQIFTGKPVFWQARQRSYGAVLGGEDDYRYITYEELRRKTGLDITEENFRDFVPKEKYEAWEKSHQESPVVAGMEEARFEGKAPVEAYYVYTTQRFGASVAYYRRCEDGYHAFYMRNRESGVCFPPLKADTFPSEKQIDLLLDSNFSWNTCDRLLSQQEAAYFFNQFTKKLDKDSEEWNDIYHSADTSVIESLSPGMKSMHHGNSNFFNRMSRCIADLAQKGVDFE